jgi:SNF2 family DNA or RNA helicase
VRFEEALKRAHELAREAPPDLPDVDELEEMDEAERERVEQMIEAVTLAKNNEQVRREVEELRQLAQKAQAVEASGKEAKLAKLNALLRERGFFDNPDQRLLIFTEFKDTLDYLVERLKAWGFRVGFIHGGMKIRHAQRSGHPASKNCWARPAFRACPGQGRRVRWQRLGPAAGARDAVD